MAREFARQDGVFRNYRNSSRIYNHHMNAITMTPSCAFNCAQCAYRRTHIIAHTEHIDVANCTVVFCTVVYYFFPEIFRFISPRIFTPAYMNMYSNGTLV